MNTSQMWNELMCARPVMESIWNQLAPADVRRLNIAINIEFTNKEKDRYQYPFKTIIADRKWIDKMCNNGYTFTLVSSQMDLIDDPSLSIDKSVNVSVLMFATKDGMIIPLTNEIMPASVFTPVYGRGDAISDRTCRRFEPLTREVVLSSNLNKIMVRIPIITARMSSYTELKSSAYSFLFDGTMSMESMTPIEPNIRLFSSSISKEGYTIGRPICTFAMWSHEEADVTFTGSERRKCTRPDSQVGYTLVPVSLGIMI